ncbi:hypothetical protein ACLMJK_008676 [Lecanora helva]
MEPITIFGLLSTAGTLASTISLTIRNLSELRAQYKDADVRIRLLIGELSTVKAALTQINDWTHCLDDTHRQADVVEGLRVSLEGCQLAMDALAEEVRSLMGGDLGTSVNPGFRTRTRYVWNESSLKEHEGRLHAQIAALQLLLQAVQHPEQAEILHRPESRQIIQRVADDTSTLRATMDRRASQSAPPTIVSHDDSTIDEKVFEWDNEIVNADAYRRAMNHAREKSEMATKRLERDEKLDTISQAETEESSDRLSSLGSYSAVNHQKPLPYEMSVVSEPVYSEQDRVMIPNSSVSDKTSSRRSILSYRLKSAGSEKKSFWSSISSKRSQRILAPPERNAAHGAVISSSSTPGSRRGRRGFEKSCHTSIDFGSEDGLSAPPIVRAAQAGSVVEVEQLLDQRADINARHSQSGRNALLVAAHCGNVEVVQLLLRYGALVNEQDLSSFSALHLASLRGHVDVVECLLQENADVDIKGPDDRTPLRVAAEKGEVEVAEVLLRKQAKVNLRDRGQMTPLHVAAKHGDGSIVALLVSHGAHLEAKDSNFMAAMHYACEGGHTDVLSILLGQKADINAHGRASMTPLMCAASAGKVNAADLLLKKKASLEHKGEGDMTALHWASFAGNVEVVELFLAKKASINAANKDGRTALHLAVMAEKFAVIDLLLQKGASIEVRCKAMLNPLHYACSRANVEITQLLLGYKANVEAEDRLRNRPLHQACSRGSLPHVELLIQKGANIDARNATGDRPLCLASSLGYEEIVRMLLSRGAAIRSKFAAGPSHEDSPLCLAAKGGHVAVTQELLMRGASALQKDERDWQPLRYAAFYGHSDVVELLLRYGATVSGTSSGGWGFNMTAQRIGFSNDILIEDLKKSQILRLLSDAEAKEQKTREHMASVARPTAPPAVQNQTIPTELPDPATVTSPQLSRPTNAAPSQPPSILEMNVEPLQSPKPTTPLHTGYSAPSQPQGNTITATAPPALTPQQIQQIYHPQQPIESQYFQNGQTPQFSAHASPVPMPSTQSYFLTGNSPNQIPVAGSAQLQPSSQLPTSYTFVPKSMSPLGPSHVYPPTSQYQPMPTAYSSGSGPPAAPSMALGPDGLWRQVPPQNYGAQPVPYQSGPSQPSPASQAPQSPQAPTISYPTGIYEMAS